MTIHPKVPMDLALAPVAVAIDLNLQRLRDKSPSEIQDDITLELNKPGAESPDGRAADVREVAVRNVELHGWDANVTDDHARLRLSGGSVQVDLGLSASLLTYIEQGAG